MLKVTVAEKEVMNKLPIFNRKKSLAPVNSLLASKNPLPNSTNANISAPEVANFFKLHPIAYKKEPSPPIMRPTLMSKKNPINNKGNISGLESIRESQDFTQGYVENGNEKK